MIPVENVDLNGATQTHESITPQGERDDSSEESLKKQNLFQVKEVSEEVEKFDTPAS